MDGLVRISGTALELPGGATVRFMRTLRLPEKGTHPLPPGLGAFPLRRVADYPERTPRSWRGRGGVLVPVHRREAMWLSLSSTAPVALQVGAGGVCAVSGRPWSGRLEQDPQNYLVLPRQPWLDGVNSGQGVTRQFVAAPPGAETAADEQGDGAELGGAVRLQVFELRPEVLEHWAAAQARAAQARLAHGGWGAAPDAESPTAQPLPPAPPPGYGLDLPEDGEGGEREAAATGLGAGGRMRQEVYRDDRPLEDWRERPSGRVVVHLATVPLWREITGEAPPVSPVDRAAYGAAGLPWFDHYDAEDGGVAECP